MGSQVKSPSTVADDSSVGTKVWTNPENAISSNDSYATATGSGDTHYLKATDFGFTIPTNALITGVLFEIEGHCDTGKPYQSFGSHLIKGGVIQEPIFSSNDWFDSVTDEYLPYGGEKYLYQQNLTPADVNASNFGIAFHGWLNSSVTAYIDHIKCTVYYEFLNASTINSPVTVVDDSSIGATAWSNPGNAISSNNSYATVTPSGGSHYLKATNFSFSVPSTATISGIKVEVECKTSENNFDYSDKLVKNDVISGNNLSDALSSWPLTDTYRIYGSPSEMWGLTLTPADVNASNFGFVLSVDETTTASVDHIRITVYYYPISQTVTSKANITPYYTTERTIQAKGSVGTAQMVKAKGDIKKFDNVKIIQAKSRIQIFHTSIINAKSFVNFLITSTIQATARIFRFGFIDEPSFGGITIPFPNEAIIAPLWEFAENTTLKGITKRNVMTRKYEYTLKWDAMFVSNYDALEAVINTLNYAFFIYKKWPQSAIGVNCIGFLSPRKLEYGSGDLVYVSSVILILIEVNSRI